MSEPVYDKVLARFRELRPRGCGSMKSSRKTRCLTSWPVPPAIITLRGIGPRMISRPFSSKPISVDGR